MLLGSIQGLIVSLLLAVNPQFKKKSNVFLVLLVLTISVQNISNGLIDAGLTELEYWPLSWTLLIPFSLWFFVTSLINPRYILRKEEYAQLIPFALQIGFKLVVFVIFLINPAWVDVNAPKLRMAMISFEIVAMVWCFWVVVRLLNKLRNHEKFLQENYSSLEGRSLSWLKNTLSAVFVIWGFWAVSFIYNVTVEELNYLSYVNWISLALITYWIAYSIMIRNSIFESSDIEVAKDADETSKQLPLKSDEHYQRLLSLMEDELLYLDSQLSMNMLAEKMNLSNGYISQIINQKEGMNFFEFVNRYRVEEVKKKIEDPQCSHLSLLGIALESGFTSKSTFNDAFKKVAGMTPSAYQKSKRVPE